MGRRREPYTQIYLHLVWATWGRRALITRDIQHSVYAALHAESDALKAAPIAIGGMDDHVHMVVRFPTTVAVARLVQQLKGSTSHLINHSGPERYRLRWQGGYGAFSISKRHVERAAAYVRNQEAHHRLGRLAPALERISEL